MVIIILIINYNYNYNCMVVYCNNTFACSLLVSNKNWLLIRYVDISSDGETIKIITLIFVSLKESSV